MQSGDEICRKLLPCVGTGTVTQESSARESGKRLLNKVWHLIERSLCQRLGDLRPAPGGDEKPLQRTQALILQGRTEIRISTQGDLYHDTLRLSPNSQL